MLQHLQKGNSRVDSNAVHLPATRPWSRCPRGQATGGCASLGGRARPAGRRPSRATASRGGPAGPGPRPRGPRPRRRAPGRAGTSRRWPCSGGAAAGSAPASAGRGCGAARGRRAQRARATPAATTCWCTPASRAGGVSSQPGGWTPPRHPLRTIPLPARSSSDYGWTRVTARRGAPRPRLAEAAGWRASAWLLRRVRLGSVGDGG